MKNKELENFKNKTIAEIDKEIRVCRERLVNLKVDLSLGKVKNVKEIKFLKKSVAQLLTIKQSRQKNQLISEISGIAPTAAAQFFRGQLRDKKQK